jgi:hypothetical protein
MAIYTSTELREDHYSPLPVIRSLAIATSSETKYARVSDGAAELPTLAALDISQLPTDKVSKFYLSLTSNALGTFDVPVFVFRSKIKGPTVGITSAIHGNEVNGIQVIQQLFRDIESGLDSRRSAGNWPDDLHIDSGIIIGIPVLNVPGFLSSIRCFDEESKQDLNRLMPGYRPPLLPNSPPTCARYSLSPASFETPF